MSEEWSANPGIESLGSGNPGNLRLRLPATSANLGAGFDAVAVAFNFYLEIEAEPATEFSIVATGRNREHISRLHDNLILEIYKRLLVSNEKPVIPLAIQMANEIPLGMGCGSSAAGRLAAIALAVHFGRLDWSPQEILEEASALEGHPDNASACWLGGFVSAYCEGRRVHVARVAPPAEWRAIVVLPLEPLATSEARAMLPDCYPRADVVANIQSAALLGLTFAQARGDLLRIAMRDQIHQPYRAPLCPLLPRLLPLAGEHGILGAALSGAGPSVLVVVASEGAVPGAAAAIHAATEGLMEPELKVCRFESAGANESFEAGQPLSSRIGTDARLQTLQELSQQMDPLRIPSLLEILKGSANDIRLRLEAAYGLGLYSENPAFKEFYPEIISGFREVLTNRGTPRTLALKTIETARRFGFDSAELAAQFSDVGMERYAEAGSDEG
jgi:homoserine kinase